VTIEKQKIIKKNVLEKRKPIHKKKQELSCSCPPHHKQEKENSSSGYKKERHCSIKMVGSAKRKLKK